MARKLTFVYCERFLMLARTLYLPFNPRVQWSFDLPMAKSSSHKADSLLLMIPNLRLYQSSSATNPRFANSEALICSAVMTD